MKSLSNKVAIVTGSSRGIGAQIAITLAEAGASVVINYSSNQKPADKIVSEINASGGSAIAIKADISSPEEVRLMFDLAISQFGKIDILINNAGSILYKTIQDTTDDDFDKIFSVNVKGTFNTLREAASRLENDGRIINLSSSTTRLMLPTYGAYCATKGAVEQLTRVFSKEVGARNITVNSISPGPVNTELFTAGKSEEVINRLASMSAFDRIGEPLDIARVVSFLVSEEASWVTGQNIGANGGFA
ncbi:MAG: 3-oxoacyl-[acyl-carrier protein] reductase [Paraglaciecola psychrophila]|jgi:3-oxoacyl-[acyl-carrier protein] reductase